MIRTWIGIDSTGWLSLNAPVINLQNSSAIFGNGAGYWGGTNTHANGYGPGYGGAGNQGGGAGGGAGYGGAGGNGGGIPGIGGSVYGGIVDTSIQMGSGGGAGRLGGVEGFGGSGGASIYLRASTLVLDSVFIKVNGEGGDSAVIVAGGGGSGGGIMVWADSTIIHNSFFQADGGSGGPADSYGGGGAGGGRIKVFYSSFLDTSDLTCSAQGGTEGIGSFGNGEPGMSGSIHVDQIVGITEVAKEPIKCITPNPIRDWMRMIIEKPPLELNLYDISGRIVKTIYLLEITATINLEGLSTGIYFLKSKNENGLTKKIVVMK